MAYVFSIPLKFFLTRVRFLRWLTAKYKYMEPNLIIKQAFFFEFIGIFVAIFASKIQIWLSEHRSNQKADEEFAQTMKRVWDGRQETKLDALLRVRFLLKQQHADAKLLERIAEEIRDVDINVIKGTTTVDQFGQIHHNFSDENLGG